MNEFVFTGELADVLDIAEGVSHNGNQWKAVEFVVKEKKDKYPQSHKFKMFGVEKVDNFVKYRKLGETVDVSFNLECREVDSQYWNSAVAWKVFGKSDGDQKSKSVEPQPEEIDDFLI